MVSEAKDKHLALASALDVSRFVPDIDTDRNVDLLPIAFNACVVNRVNLNGDVVDTKTALAMYRFFVNKPINIEHNRQKVIGTVLSAGFSEFGTDAPMTEESVKDFNGPFNITLGAVVWKVVNNHLTDLIEESNDPTSENYMKISASWELGFTDYELVLMDGENKNISSGTFISDAAQVDELKENLRVFGGTGKMKDGRSIYRKVVNDVVPLGIGLTETPAADVKGVSIKQRHTKLNDKKCESGAEIPENKENNNSQLEEKNVNITKRFFMNINSIKDITDENLKELSASAISNFIEEELKIASDKYIAEQQSVEKSLEAAKEESKSLREESDKTKEELVKVKTTLEAFEVEQTKRLSEEAFNLRMADLDEEYELDDADREVIASDIKAMDHSSFETYKKKMSVLMRSKNKKTLKDKAKAQVETKIDEAKAEASNEAPEADKAEETVDQVLDSAQAEVTNVPVSTTFEEPTLHDKYKKAFSVENWIK